jgi:hypothetical protein
VTSDLERLRRALYLAQRGIGDAQAAQQGRLAKRLIRRQVVRSIFRMFR